MTIQNAKWENFIKVLILQFAKFIIYTLSLGLLRPDASGFAMTTD